MKNCRKSNKSIINFYPAAVLSFLRLSDIHQNEKTCLINLHKKEQSNLKSQLYQDHVKVEDRLKCEITRAENRLEARQNELEVLFK